MGNEGVELSSMQTANYCVGRVNWVCPLQGRRESLVGRFIEWFRIYMELIFPRSIFTNCILMGKIQNRLFCKCLSWLVFIIDDEGKIHIWSESARKSCPFLWDKGHKSKKQRKKRNSYQHSLEYLNSYIFWFQVLYFAHQILNCTKGLQLF